jgi:MoxR-like ATPase
MPADISALAADVLSHRLVLTYEALADGITARSLVEQVLEAVEPPHVAPSQDAGAA